MICKVSRTLRMTETIFSYQWKWENGATIILTLNFGVQMNYSVWNDGIIAVILFPLGA